MQQHALMRLQTFFQDVFNNRIEEVAKFLIRDPALACRAKEANGNTPLMLAVLKGYICLSELLISHNAPLDSRNDSGQTALMIAAIKGFPKILILLLNAGADPDCQDLQGRTALMLACQYDLRRTAQVLILSGSDLGLTDGWGKSVVDYCSREMLNFISNHIERERPFPVHRVAVQPAAPPQAYYQEIELDYERLLEKVGEACRSGKRVDRRPIQDLLWRPGVCELVDSVDRVVDLNRRA